MIKCSMVSGEELDIHMSVVLFCIAQNMLTTHDTRRSVHDPSFEVHVKMRYTPHTPDDLGGYLFFADLKWEKGRTKVSFMLQEFDLRDFKTDHDSSEGMFPDYRCN